MAKSKSARAGATAFVRKFARKSEGVKIMNQLGFIPLVCSFISENIKNSPMVIESFDALIAAADHVVSISDNNLVLMADTALLALKDDPENIAVCKKALELLQKLADNSELIRSKLSEYERSSALSKFKNETDDLELKQLVDALKASLKGAKVAIDAEEILKKIEENSSKIEEKQTNEAILGETFNLSEQLVAASAEEKTLEKLRRLGAVGILGASIARIEKAAHSEMRDDVQRNLLSVLNALNADGAQCPKLLEAKFYDSLARMFSAQKASEGLKAEIRKSFAAFSAHRSEQFAAINVANSSNSSAQTLVPLIDNAAVLTQVLLQAPRDSHDGFKAVHGEIDVVVAIIKKHAGNPEVMLAATRLLDLLVSVDGDNRGYFTSTYVESLCRLTKENADNEEFCAAMLGLLNKYENDEGVATLISDLKNWYFNRSLETNLEVLKLHLLGEIYDRMDDEEKYNEVQRLLQRLMHCYDPKNELVDLAAEATKADQEVVKLVPFLLKQQTSEQVKMQVVALIWQMVASGKVERVFYDSGALALMIKGMKEAKSREERIVYIKALSPFLQSKDSAIRGLVQGEINNLLLSSIDMDENARMLLLEDVINGARDDQNNILLSSACLESLLALFEKQTTAEGKARVLHLIANMAGVSEECANTLVTESGLAITLNALEHNMESQGYVAEMTHFTVNLATHHDCVNGLFDAEVDSIMKGVMFQYTGEKDIFHNAQRTIDLMNLSRLDLTPEQHKKWMQRSRVKHFMTELCRALGIMISTVLTKGEREVRTGDTHYDISRECMRILNEFGPSFDEMIETDSSTVLLTLLGKAWLLRSVLMAYTFLVEKDVSARSIFNAPKEIKDTLVAKCGYTAMWDFENKEFESSLCAVRGGITHQSTRVFLDASVEPQTCQELDVVTKEPIGREYTLEDLISWVKLDTEEKDTLRCFNLVLIWVVNNWHLVTITASMLGNKPKDKPFNFKLIELDGEFLATRCGLTWNWPRILDETNGYLLNSDIKEKYPLVEQIKKDEKKGGVHIKVKISGEELRQKRREIKDTLEFSHSNVLTGDEKDSLDFFIDISNKVFTRLISTNHLKIA
ncbi:hypothetical protein MHBO_001568 [Bonamia ostreae]|uniref:Uncharacterized protein n=1 Tax=Bonamia ostreae TaxID=126728 RepID=A0ABV2AJE0_9EUKA